MKINEKLIWDYDFSQEERQGEFFRKWYLARVLSRGGIADIRSVGLEAIRDSLPQLFLPRKIRLFWEWFFSLPEVQRRYGHPDPPPKKLHP